LIILSEKLPLPDQESVQQPFQLTFFAGTQVFYFGQWWEFWGLKKVC